MLQRLLDNMRRSAEAERKRRIQRDIQQMETLAEQAAGVGRGAEFNRIGDAWLRAGQPHRALISFGNAIDAYLQAGLMDAAPALCRKVIRFAPWVVRTRGTLATISLAEGMFRDAEQEIEDYVRASDEAWQAALTTKRLRLMGMATDSPQIRMRIGEFLLDLGDPRAADQLFGVVFSEKNGLRAPLSHDPEERWGRLLPVALLGPKEMLELEKKHLLSGSPPPGAF